jgi:predicted ABC-type ATPase
VVDTFEQLAENALNTNDNFVYEGHFINHATWDMPRRFKDAGYEVNLLFFGLSNPDLSQLRVTDRVTEGGHYVDRNTLENNFTGNLEMLNLNFRMIDNLTIVDTSEIAHVTLAKLSSGEVAYAVTAEELPDWFINYLPAITSLIE